ncbi:MAG: hypothetical protein AWU55_1610 [Halomonadaceae bacterium T82-2]|nr:MAG: hypothetical protein AWU55_1610 [Halomonadaceae bacterium T82-2]
MVALRRHLLSTSEVYFSSLPGARSQTGWAGNGEGRVAVTTDEDGSVVFTESGRFHPAVAPDAPAVSFRNVFRWRFLADRVSLAHERRGAEAAVRLFDLAPEDTANTWASCHDHICGDDRYRAWLVLGPLGFDLRWTIEGPRKDEHLHYRYRRAASAGVR